MRIGFDAKRAFHNGSGLGNYSRTLIRLLQDYHPENEYFLYTPNPEKARFSDFVSSKAIIRQPRHFPWSRFQSAWRSLNMGKDIMRDGAELFHGLSNELPLNLKAKKLKKLVTIHDLIFLHHPELYKPIDRIIYKRKFRFSSQIADCVIAISEQTKRDLVQCFNINENKIKVVYQPCDPAFTKKVNEEEIKILRKSYDLPEDFILYVGTIEPRKNLLSLVKALHEGKIEFPLVIVGKETPYVQRVRDYIEKHRMDQIWFLKNVPNKQMPALYQMARLFVYPSSYEGFGLPVLEAVSSGVPVIAATGSCLEETGGDAAMYVDPSDIHSFSSTISEVLFSESKRKSMIEKGNLHARKFVPQECIHQLWKVYESLG